MPWRERSPVDLRMQFITELQSGLWTLSALAAQYEISRRTAYKWRDRYAAAGPGGLVDRSRRPHGHPATTDPELVDALLAVRRRHPDWGANKLLATVKRTAPTKPWPARSTVADLLHRHGLILARPRRRARPHGPRPVLAAIDAPNDTWTTDFKGEFRTGDHRYCYPLTLRDAFSRYVLRCDGLLGRTYLETRGRFERAFAEYGLPRRIRSDNGEPFASSGVARLTRLNVWWMRLGIEPERIALGHPEENGSHEQFHRVLKAATTRPPAAHLTAQQRRFAAFCREYNYDRPHESLANASPASVYQASPRPLPRRLPPLVYAGHFEVRRVAERGTLSWKGHAVFLSEVLAGEDVGLEEVDDGLWTLYFGSTILGRFEEQTRRIAALPVSGNR